MDDGLLMKACGITEIVQRSGPVPFQGGVWECACVAFGIRADQEITLAAWQEKEQEAAAAMLTLLAAENDSGSRRLIAMPGEWMRFTVCADRRWASGNIEAAIVKPLTAWPDRPEGGQYIPCHLDCMFAFEPITVEASA